MTGRAQRLPAPGAPRARRAAATSARGALVRRALALALATALALLGARGAAAAPPLVELLALGADAQRAAALPAAELESLAHALDEQDPAWPIAAYLVGEIHLRRGEPARGLGWMRRVALAHVSGPQHVRDAPSAVAALALWRWLQNAPQGDAAAARERLEAGEAVLATRAARRVWGFGLFPSLPQLREDVYRRLLAAAVRAGDDARAQALLMDYLRYATSTELDPVAERLLEARYAAGTASADRIDLLRAQSLLDLHRLEEAYRLLRRAREGGDPEVAEQSRLLEARLQRRRGDAPQDVLYTLDRLLRRQPEPAIEQAALNVRALVLKGTGRRLPARRDFQRLVDEFPGGTLVDDALIELARDHQMANELVPALQLFQRVIDYRGPNDWPDTARVHAALTRYIEWRRSGDEAAIDEAVARLEQVRETNRPGTLHALAGFWLARIAAERGRTQRAAERLGSLVERYPYDYYGIRARMRLAALGDAARWRALDAVAVPDAAPAARLRADFAASRAVVAAPGASPAHARLAQALESGLYAAALDAEQALRRAVPDRGLEALELEDLDAGGWIPRLGVLIALRIDASAAKEAVATPDNLLGVAGLLNRHVSDPATVLSLIIGSGLDVRRHPAYLHTAYPPAHREALRAAAGEQAGLADVLYAVVRRESLFFPRVTSGRSATGLFQITPRRFEELERAHGLLAGRRPASYAELLLDPGESIRIGRLHLADSLLPRYDGNLVLALMAHNAGEQAVDDWRESWQALGISGDVELLVETARATETRNFVRRVLTDVAIVRSAGLLR